jgi:TnpA family transposase
MLPRVDLPELILEIAARTRFTAAFTHISERTARDSLSLLAVVFEQQTDLQPTQSMTDTGAYSDVVFGLFLARLPLQPASG